DGDRTREDAEPQQSRDVPPVGSRLAQYAPVQRQVVHRVSATRSRATASRTVAMAAVDCSSTRQAKNPAPSPNTAAAIHARSRTARYVIAANPSVRIGPRTGTTGHQRSRSIWW